MSLRKTECFTMWHVSFIKRFLEILKLRLRSNSQNR